MSDDIPQQIDGFVEAVREHWQIPGVALTIVRRSGPVLVRAYGVKDHAKATSADNDTAFAIGSCSKAFTTTLAAALVDDGKLAWDDPIRKYLPSFQLTDPWVSDHITIRDVLSNRTGLSRASISEYGSDLSRTEVLARAQDIQPICEFRDQFTYCNLGFVAAAEAMAAATGEPFEQLVEDRILKPLGMKNSTVANDPWPTHSNIALPHAEAGGQVVPVKLLAVDNCMGAGSVTISAQDAVAWLGMHLGGGEYNGRRIVSEKNLRETHIMQIPSRDRTEFDGYGMGWNVCHWPRDCLNLHAGAVSGFRAIAWFDTEDDWAGFVSVNNSYHPAHAAISAFFRQIRKQEEPRDWIRHFDCIKAEQSARNREKFEHERSSAPIASSSWALDDFVGTYWHKGFGRLHIERRRDHLWFRIEDYSISDSPLVRYSSLCFEHQRDQDVPITEPKPITGDTDKIRFRETGGRITHLDWNGWFGNAQFQREPYDTALGSIR
jgi:CubicO group peptidase (beta-lactamase class C family)